MYRISNNLLSNNFLFNINRHENQMSDIQKKIGSQREILLPSDDPVATTEYMSQRSRLSDIERYRRGIDLSKGRIDTTEAKLRDINELLKRAKELSVQAANGVYTAEDRQKIGVEIDQILEEVVQIANTKYKGESLFGGTITDEEAFKVSTSKIIDPTTGNVIYGKESISKVEYQGDIYSKYFEVGRGEYIASNIPGSNAFWASNQVITSNTPGTGYIATKDQTIRIDGVEIQIKQGDNINSIVQKINSANLNVRAEVDNTTGQNLLILRTTVPHQMYLEDLGGGTVLQDLGVLSSSVSKPPYNYAPSASVYGETVFDVLIGLRNSLYKNDIEGINRSIGSIDQSISSVLDNLAYAGSIQRRIEDTQNRLSAQEMYAKDIINRINGLDMAKAVTDLKNIETEYNAALQIGARIIPKTLLDYLR